MRTAFFTGLINWGVGVFNLWVFRRQIPETKRLILLSAVTGIVLVTGFLYSFRLIAFADALNYQDRVVFTTQTPYQHIVVTKWNSDTRLFINGNLQFSSVDEYRYHEPLVHFPMLVSGSRDSILVLGGGDGLAIREILKYPDVKGIDLVDLDAEMVRICREQPIFRNLNGGSLSSPKVRFFDEDAFNFIKKCGRRYNVIIVDLPDPSDAAVGKLYTVAFYNMLRQIVAADGVVVTQSTSPFLARKPFWCINNTLEAAFPQVVPYQAYVPSFGQWGFNMGFPVKTTRDIPQTIREKIPQVSPLQFLTTGNVPGCFVFDRDTEELPQPVNTLEKMELVDLYSSSYWDFH